MKKWLIIEVVLVLLALVSVLNVLLALGGSHDGTPFVGYIVAVGIWSLLAFGADQKRRSYGTKTD